MPDSAVKRHAETPAGELPATQRRRRAASSPATPDSADTETKLARAARSAQRLAQLSEGARSGETLDLFAEDAERAQLQAMNTDIRQGTFEGFELPEVFLAAVQSNGGQAAEPSAAKRAARESVASVGPIQGSFEDDAFAPVAAEAPASESETVAKPAAMAAAASRAASISCVDAGVAPRAERALAPNDASAPVLDRARAKAFADTIDALYAVLAEQRTAAAAHAGRMKTMLTIIVCVMLGTVATGIAQTAVLMRMSRDGKLEQDRMEQLMLNQQATLATLFDTDSATVSLRPAPDIADDASPVPPVGPAEPTLAPKKHAQRSGPTSH
ncbi:hypothetical protein [Caballeronia insecticola]|uniref:Uncharacterized protein n=1 Tax=Caballeronia insecticola TaxID=758793 RepID=R4X358_9BURK|nr:hypothetical protein [Caballeronia insecticola]BAN26067.1 putative uncharacterized protein [Caballeronia insecticola]